MEVKDMSIPVLGSWIKPYGVQFGIYAEHNYGMVIKIYQASDKVCKGIYYLADENNRTGNIYHIVLSGVDEGDYYTWHIVQSNGDLSKPLMDPYALGFEEIEKDSNTYYSVVVQRTIKKYTRPKIKWEDTVLYELHVGGFTKSDESLDKKERGTIDGITAKLGYLKELGITTLELLPIFKWNRKSITHQNPFTGEVLFDVWGYNPISFFALQEEYVSGSTVMCRIEQFKQFVECVHEYGMEIILDVVYNHTGEGGRYGSVFHFKELGNNTYYKMDGHDYRNCTGTGNVLNTTHPITKQLIIDSLRYWVIEMGVDGFRFDLASTLGQDEHGKWMQYSLLDDIVKDPILKDVKLISESWDAKGSYNVGQMPYPFAEWSDCFRDTMRRFVKGDVSLTREVARCIEGNDIEFIDKKKSFNECIHFITAHDGFTLWDLVSYNNKHNEVNGENNRDGNNTNHSDNCGYEGDTDEEVINILRIKKMKNYLVLLFISYGVPMLLMGDETGRSKRGNNNTYCQDNELFWVNWKEEYFRADLRVFIKQLTKFRKDAKYLRLKDETSIVWHGVIPYQPDWSYHSCSLACEIICRNQHFYIIMNSYCEILEFELPKIEGKWYVIIDTTSKECIEQKEIVEQKYKVQPYSIIILQNNRL